MIFYTGSYTQEGAPAIDPIGKGIGCFQFNTETGQIVPLHYTKQGNPSYVAISENKKYLYAVEEMFEELDPQIYAYCIGDNGQLTLLNSQKLIGDYACHITITQQQLVVANYVSGNVIVYPISDDGSLGEIKQIIQHKGKGPNVERQEAAHAHMVYPFDSDKLFVVDLGLDKAVCYQMNDSLQWVAIPKYNIKIEAGAGARHMVMSANEQFAYILSELKGELFVAQKDDKGFSITQKLSFVPKGYTGIFGGAAIRIHPSGKFIFTSCRGTDSISVFKVNEENGKLSLAGHYGSAGKTPRDFNIDPSGQWLIVANQDSNSLAVFKIDSDTGKLSNTASYDVETPVNISWL